MDRNCLHMLSRSENSVIVWLRGSPGATLLLMMPLSFAIVLLDSRYCAVSAKEFTDLSTSKKLFLPPSNMGLTDATLNVCCGLHVHRSRMGHKTRTRKGHIRQTKTHEKNIPLTNVPECPVQGPENRPVRHVHFEEGEPRPSGTEESAGTPSPIV